MSTTPDLATTANRSWHRFLETYEPVLRPFTTLELYGDRVARLQNYFYNAELLVDLAGELDVPVRINGHRWWTAEGS
jgi:hypothetical protein